MTCEGRGAVCLTSVPPIHPLHINPFTNFTHHTPQTANTTHADQITPDRAAATMPKKWIPLESNPDVITEFAGRIGLDTAQFSFHDVFGLDPEVRVQQTRWCSVGRTVWWFVHGVLPGQAHTHRGGAQQLALRRGEPLAHSHRAHRVDVLLGSRRLSHQLLAMVPQPVLAVLLLFPITKESDEADKKGAPCVGLCAARRTLARDLAQQCTMAWMRLAQPPDAGTCARDVTPTTADAERQAAAGAGDAAAQPAQQQPLQPYYMKQTIGNACGTIAMLHAIGNNLSRLAVGEWRCGAPSSLLGTRQLPVGEHERRTHLPVPCWPSVTATPAPRHTRPCAQRRAPSCSASLRPPGRWTPRSAAPTWSHPPATRQTSRTHTRCAGRSRAGCCCACAVAHVSLHACVACWW